MRSDRNGEARSVKNRAPGTDASGPSSSTKLKHRLKGRQGDKLQAAPDMLKAALWYAARGYRVIPLHTPKGNGGCSCGVLACKSAGKHPRTPHGVRDASTDLKQVREWFTAWPDANIGIATGDRAGVVLDIDPRHGGDDSLADLTEEHGTLPDVPEVRTGSGGTHYYFAWDADNDPGSPTGIFPGIDLRSEGSLVVAPPSLHPSGHRYKWVRSPHRDEVLPPLPDFLTGAARKKNKRPAIEDGKPIRQGERRDTLLRVAGAMRRQGADEESILAALLNLNERRCEPPLEYAEVLEVAHNTATSWEPEPDGQGFEFTDIGNAERMVARHGENVRITPAHGLLMWNGQRWARTGKDALKRLAIETVQAIPQETRPDFDDDEKKKVLKWFLTSQSNSKLDAAIAIFTAHEKVNVGVGEFDSYFDSHKYLFNVRNGTLDLESGDLLEHHREHHLTKIAPVTYDPEAECPNIDAWLHAMLPPDTVKVIYEFIGLLLVDEWRFKTMLFLLGPTNTGKSTLIRLIEALLGSELVSHQSLQQIAHDRFSAAELFGKLANFCADLPNVYIQDSSKVKQATGGDVLQAERKFGQPFSFRNKARFIFSANEMPNARDKTDAWAGRHRIIRFDKVVTKEQRKKDPDFEDRLRAELPGLLNRAVEGYQRLRANGDFTRSASMDEAHREWLGELRPMSGFFDEYLIVDPKGRVPKNALYAKALQVVPPQGKSVMTAQEFNKQVKTHFGENVRDKTLEGKRIKRDGLWAWQGIRLRDSGGA